MDLEGAATQDAENCCGVLMGQHGLCSVGSPERDIGPGRLSIWILHQKKGSFSYTIIQIIILYI